MTSLQGNEQVVDAELAATPPMGFNTWNCFAGSINEQVVLGTAEALVASGMAASGYTYMNIDDGWMAAERSPAGDLMADPVKFPGGMAAIADEVHGMGLKFGIYSDAGCRTCMGLPASFGREERDAVLFADWGVDFLKYDWCHVPFEMFPGKSERQVAEVLYTRMARAIVAAGRPVVFSMCNWGGEREPWLWARSVCHMWRTTSDIKAAYEDEGRYPGFATIFQHNVCLGEYARPGAWNDPDMLEVGNGLTWDEDRAHFGLWAMMSAPLLAGNDLRSMSKEVREILCNQEVIAIDQDPLGRQCKVSRRAEDVWILTKRLTDGRSAVAAFNTATKPVSVQLTAADAEASWTVKGYQRCAGGVTCGLMQMPPQSQRLKCPHMGSSLTRSRLVGSSAHAPPRQPPTRPVSTRYLVARTWSFVLSFRLRFPGVLR